MTFLGSDVPSEELAFEHFFSAKYHSRQLIRMQAIYMSDFFVLNHQNLQRFDGYNFRLDRTAKNENI